MKKNENVNDHTTEPVNQSEEDGKNEKIMHDDDFSEDLDSVDRKTSPYKEREYEAPNKSNDSMGILLIILSWVALILGWFVNVGPDVFIWGIGTVVAYVGEKQGRMSAKLPKWLNLISIIYIVVQIVRFYVM